MGQFISKTRDGAVVFNIDCAVPAEQAEAFAEAMTGNDDDIVLAAEQAMRERLGYGDGEEVELAIPDEADVKAAVRTHGEENFRI